MRLGLQWQARVAEFEEGQGTMALKHRPSEPAHAFVPPIALLAAPKLLDLSDKQLVDGLRRMGLQPVAMQRPDGQSGHMVAMGELRAVISRCSDSEARDAGATSADAHYLGQSRDQSLPSATMALCMVQPMEALPRPAQTRLLMQLACLIADLLEARSVFWSPARLWSPAATFREAVSEMLTSGMPPVLHIIAFFPDEQDRFATRGLGYFCGQELLVTKASGLDQVGQLRRLARLAIDMMTNGPIVPPRRFAGMVAGEEIILSALPGDDAVQWLGVEIGAA